MPGAGSASASRRRSPPATTSNCATRRNACATGATAAPKASEIASAPPASNRCSGASGARSATCPRAPSTTERGGPPRPRFARGRTRRVSAASPAGWKARWSRAAQARQNACPPSPRVIRAPRRPRSSWHASQGASQLALKAVRSGVSRGGSMAPMALCIDQQASAPSTCVAGYDRWMESFLPQACAYLRKVVRDGECFPVASDRSRRATAGA